MTRAREIAASLKQVQGEIAEALESVGRAPDDLTLIVVTKTFPVGDAQILYDLGVRQMGENRDEEGAHKSEQLPRDIKWHFQGQVQGRKIKSIASWADVVHSLDSISHATKFAANLEVKPIEFFLQVNLEPSRADRGGVAPREVVGFLNQLSQEALPMPIGLMTVAPLEMAPLAAFGYLAQLRNQLNSEFPSVGALSMGMSGDFKEAILAGATHIRVGKSILGSRGYPA
jgi:pyridoxal phosphate enzyme (YggS family)